MNLLSFDNKKTRKLDISDGPCTIAVGDVHGDLNQLIYPLKLFLSDPERYTLVYLGDYIDRGESNVYIYEIINALYQHPKIHFLFGNHELYDKGVVDYFSYHSPNKTKGDSFIKTFTYDLFNKLPLKLTYYNEQTKILYSHSPLNRPLSIIKSLPITVENAYTYDKGSQKMEYKNIHGHDHLMSSDDVIHLCFNTSTVNMISIDNDASYGVAIMQNAMTKGTKNWLDGAESNVTYLIIDDKDISRYKIVREKNIKYSSDRDYNYKSFEIIKKDLEKCCKKDDFIKKYISKMNLEYTFKHLKTIIKDNNITEFINETYKNNYLKHSNDNSANVYYHDLPIEIYQMFGVSFKLKYIPVHRLYWKYILKNEQHKQITEKESMTSSIKGGQINNEPKPQLNIFMILISSILIIVVMIMILLTMLIMHRQRQPVMTIN